jgi:4-hydroxybenzoate polyprenyltransferase
MSASGAKGGLADAVQALRLHQWSKNVLVWIAPIGAHRMLEPELVRRSALAFVAFGLVASSLYIVNDLRDREADRLHARKRERAIARGALSPRVAWGLSLSLLGVGFAISLLLPPAFGLTLAAYAAASALYTFALKRLVVADVLVLAALYIARMYGGAFAAGISLSHWLATFALFVFLSLALLKRATELLDADGPLAGRDYLPVDRLAVVAMGTTASYIAVLVLALYIVSPEVWTFYSNPARLWALCPLVLYALTRLWILACRGRVAEDPVVFALRDPASWVIATMGAGVLWIAS